MKHANSAAIATVSNMYKIKWDVRSEYRYRSYKWWVIKKKKVNFQDFYINLSAFKDNGHHDEEA